MNRLSIAWIVALLTTACGGAKATAPAQTSPAPTATATATTVSPHPPGTAAAPTPAVPGAAVPSPATASPVTAASSATDPIASADLALAMDLYGRQAKSQTGNLLFSPSSVETALGMTYLGARGDTASQMSAVLHLSGIDDVPAAFETHAQAVTANAAGTLTVANALWGQTGLTFVPSFTKTMNDSFGAPMTSVDFTSSSASDAINHWASDRTHGNITSLVPPGPMADAALVLTNAVYFKGSWAHEFDLNATAPAPFHRLTGGDVTAQLMQLGAPTTLGTWNGKGFTAVELPYSDGTLAMDILLPDANDGLSGLESMLTPALLKQMIAGFAPREEQVLLPRLHFGTSSDLSQTLAAMGMPLAFSEDSADFSGMGDGSGKAQKGLYISNVFHDATLDVDEHGTTATAATAVVMNERAVIRIPEIRVDHPFVLIIRDTRSGDILFMGRVVDPTA
jgi:serpin B